MAEETKQPFYSYGPAFELDQTDFEKSEELQAWADRIERAWAPIFQIETNAIHPAIRSSFDHNRSVIRNVIAAAREHSNQKAPESKAKLDQALKGFAKRRIPLTSTAFPEYFSDLLGRFKPNVAAATVAAFGDLMNPPIDITDQDVRLGLFAASAFRLSLDSNASVAAVRRIQGLVVEYEKGLSDLESQRVLLRDSAAETIAEALAAARTQRDADRRETDQAVAEFDETGKAAISSIRATEAAYNEQMKLQSSVSYWTEASRRHRTSEKKVRFWLFTYIAIALPAMILSAIALAWVATQGSGEFQSVHYVKYAAIGLLITTVVFWFGRLLLKIMLSERHLAIDAEERVTMVQTYLALTKEDKLDKADRGLALNVLFRSGSDGIVKDDGAPDTQIANLLSRLPNTR